MKQEIRDQLGDWIFFAPFATFYLLMLYLGKAQGVDSIACDDTEDEYKNHAYAEKVKAASKTEET